jgi:hypothetical protein
MHLIRLLLAGIHALRHGEIRVDVGSQRDLLSEIKCGAMSWDEVERRRLQLHAEFDAAFEKTELPERPDYERVSLFLVNARRAALNEALP